MKADVYLQFDVVRAASTPVASRTKYINAPSWDLFEASRQASPAKVAEATTPISGFAAFMAKTRVVSEPVMGRTTENDDSLKSPQSASSRRRSKRKKAKLPVPEPECDPLSWDALQQKFVQAEVPEVGAARSKVQIARILTLATLFRSTRPSGARMRRRPSNWKRSRRPRVGKCLWWQDPRRPMSRHARSILNRVIDGNERPHALYWKVSPDDR